MLGRLTWAVWGVGAFAAASCKKWPAPCLPDQKCDQDTVARCEADHGFPDTPSALTVRRSATPPGPAALVAAIGSDCPPVGCGVNGVWMGRGVNFRTLHTNTNAANKEGVRITGFRQGPNALTLRIENNTGELIGQSASGDLKGLQLRGAVITLAGPVDSYELTIQDVQQSEYWADCPTCSASQTSIYVFEAVSVNHPCHIRICQPGLDDEPPGGLRGRAVIFRGDYYDEKKHGVTTMVDPSNPDAGDDVFNLACMGTTLSKLYMFRHTSASGAIPPMAGAPAGTITSVPQREALLKAITADYCGDGSSFTQNGRQIRFGFSYLPLNANSPHGVGYLLPPATAAGATVDAAWTSGGASCIGMPRLLAAPPVPPANRPAGLQGTTQADVLSEINKICITRGGHSIPDCSTSVALATPFGLGNDIVSANPGLPP